MNNLRYQSNQELELCLNSLSRGHLSNETKNNKNKQQPKDKENPKTTTKKPNQKPNKPHATTLPPPHPPEKQSRESILARICENRF